MPRAPRLWKTTSRPHARTFVTKRGATRISCFLYNECECVRPVRKSQRVGGRLQNSITQREIWMQQGVRTEGNPRRGFSPPSSAEVTFYIYIRFLHLSLFLFLTSGQMQKWFASTLFIMRRDVISDILAPAAADSGVREKNGQFVDVMLAACTFELLRVH